MIIGCKYCGESIKVAGDTLSAICPQCTMLTSQAVETKVSALEQEIEYYNEKKGLKHKARLTEKKLEAYKRRIKAETEASEDN